ncbi:uncharacterized protein LOC108913689 isoform X2 [Anoplophora glabripennis]|uniref:uncharacterized protein LOC108913689 isoform X2 n=1 Tax=Anoplophora glabripennis TaxID=217634 RepID=UPI000C77D781|nr:uncharacterized protein LOC108913689 isoform X2 [Anoplophora glabripennis]
MIHHGANTHIEQNIPGPSSPVAASTHSNNTPVPILAPPMPQDVIEIDVENIGDEIIPELSPSLLDDLQNEFADLPFNNRRQTANQMDAAIADIPTREDIQQDIERLRNIENRLPTYLLASERIVLGGTYNLGPLDQMCIHCSAFYFHVERLSRGHYTKCCRQGNVVLENLPPMPDVLEALFQGLHPLSAHFRRYILLYNYSFQFVSLEANLRDLPARGPYVFSVRGKVYHHISNVNVNEPLQRYGPIYFLDPDDAVNARAQNNNQVLDRRLIVLLEQLLRDINPYARAYMHLRERYNLERQTIDRLRAEAVRDNVEPPPLQMPNITLELLNVRGINRRQYDLPRVEEVAAVYNLMPDAPATPNMRIYVRDEPTRFQNVSEESEHNDPLVFPLLFPQGEPGWYIGMPHRNGNRNITLCEYYAYRFGIRNNDTRLKYGGRLTQQFAVTAYIKIENNRLKYILRNQERLRVTEYVGLADYLHRRVQEGNENDEAATLGRMVILPSTFIGSPRYQQQLFQDAMAVVGRFGIPSLFITMTTNARWPEIVDNIPAGYTASDHPSLMDRVFQCKLNEMIDDVLKKHIFGVHVANLYVIEFQKRGLPHCHNLLILRDGDKLTDPRRIDAFISAEIPDPQLEPELYEIVTSFMVHGPCGELNPDSVCMVNGQCSKKYPKEFSELTVISEKGQVSYKRPNNGRTLTIRANNRNCILDNRWIVPYNPYILLKYKCHINIEACATTQCVKYLYKYLFKGVDLALVRINVENQANYNEVENYLNARYMTPPEACWHINQFETHKNTHTVYRLCVHLPTRQMVRFQPGFEIQALENNEITQLTAWFLLNQNDPDARQYLYTDIPYHYVWNSRTKRWTRRQRGANKIVTRMYSVSIRNQELYYLRLLLLHVPGAISYEELRTLNGVIYDTFKEACQHRNLLADDVEWKRTLREACSRDMPYQLRSMFAFILVFCEVSDAPALWDEFRDYFMEDFRRHGLSEERALQQTLQCIQTTLLLNGTRLASYGLPEPAEMVIRFDPINIETERVQGQEMYENLNHEQRTICNAVMNAVHDDNDPNRLFLVNAAAGSGKSYLFQTLISKLRGEELPVLVACPTGIAASILKGGRTIHSVFKLPFDINETTTTGISPTTSEGRYIASCKLLIIDEVSMVTNLIFNIIERALRDICSDNRPFGNKVTLLGGDFRQTLPVVVGGNRCTIVNACIKSSRHWPLFTNYDLQTNVRAIQNHEFATWLLNLGNGTLQPLRRTIYGNIVQIPTNCYVTSVPDLIEFCFDDMDPTVAISRAILVPTNNISHSINKKVLQKLEGLSKTYCSADCVDTTDDPAAEVANYTVEFLNSLTPSGLPPHKLVLKEGAVIMLLRNLNLKKGLCNGTRLIVRLLGNQYIDAEKTDSSGRPTGERVFIPRIDLKTGGDTLPFKLKRRQFPVQLAYTMTIHKSQGQTFNRVGIYLEEPVFTHGQLYVAFSRAKNIEDVKIYMLQRPEQGKLLPNAENIYTRNVVYREVL